MLAGITDPEILRYYQYYKVNTAQLVSQFDSYAAKPPLAFNADLMASSRQQSLYQASSGVQSHDSADGTTFDKRIVRHRLPSGVRSGRERLRLRREPFFGHVGLMADWGVPVARPPPQPAQHRRVAISRYTARSASPPCPRASRTSARSSSRKTSARRPTPASPTSSASCIRTANGNGLRRGRGPGGRHRHARRHRLLRRHHRHRRLRHPAARQRLGHADDHRLRAARSAAARQDRSTTLQAPTSRWTSRPADAISTAPAPCRNAGHHAFRAVHDRGPAQWAAWARSASRAAATSASRSAGRAQLFAGTARSTAWTTRRCRPR